MSAPARVEAHAPISAEARFSHIIDARDAPDERAHANLHAELTVPVNVGGIALGMNYAETLRSYMAEAFRDAGVAVGYNYGMSSSVGNQQKTHTATLYLEFAPQHVAQGRIQPAMETRLKSAVRDFPHSQAARAILG